jgi:hypothetical protein
MILPLDRILCNTIQVFKKNNEAGGVAQVVEECLVSVRPSTTKKKKMGKQSL